MRECFKKLATAYQEDGQTTLQSPIVAASEMELFITEYPGEFQAELFEVPVLYADGSVQPVGEGLALYVGSDLVGNLVGVATYGGPRGGQEGRSGVTVTAKGPGETRQLTTSTDAEGLFAFPLADLLRGRTRGLLTLTARHGEEDTTSEVEVSDFSLALTPRSLGGRGSHLNLAGRWRFGPDPPAGFQAPDFDGAAWPTIRVPGHWVQQGFHSEQGIGGYRRKVKIPADWAGQRIKLSFDGVYSGAEVWVNGERAGSHEGGATPFEFDVTDLVHCGEANLVAVRVQEHTEASRLDKMSSYAHFPLTGIYRGAWLFPVPPVHLVRLHAETYPSLDRKGAECHQPPVAGHREVRPWMLRLLLALVNGSLLPAEKVKVQFTLTDPEGRKVCLPFPLVEESLDAWERKDRTLEVPIVKPILGDAEHPHLYTLAAEVVLGKAPPGPGEQWKVRVRRRIGFRQVEVRGPHFCVNGQRVTLGGTCRHDAWPSTGRTVTPELLRWDFELMRQANLNAGRIRHYPPAPELLDLADEMGFYVEEDGTTPLDIATYHNPTLLQGVLDAASADRPVLALVARHHTRRQQRLPKHQTEPFAGIFDQSPGSWRVD